jgi:hypothetical protein
VKSEAAAFLDKACEFLTKAEDMLADTNLTKLAARLILPGCMLRKP